MYAVEFETVLKNGLIKVPERCQSSLAGHIKVIILKNEAAPTHKSWPQNLLAFEGMPDMPPFESYRGELSLAKDDPLA